MAPMPRTPQTAEQLKNTAELLTQQGNELLGEAEKVASYELPRIDVRNFDQCRRAMEYISNYISAVRAAIHDAREARGDFGGAPVSDTPAPKPKKPGTKQHRSGHQAKSTDTKNKP